MSENPSPQSTQAGHELSDANTRAITWVAIAFIATFAGAQLALKSAFLRFHAQEQKSEVKTTDPSLLKLRQKAPEPGLQLDSAEDLRSFLNRENQRLSTYGWVDRKNRIARVPIQRAIELLLEGKK